MRRLALTLVLATLLLGSLVGCAHRVRIESDPPGAVIKVGRRARGPAPQELTFLWLPFRPIKVRVAAPGYRPVEVKASSYAGLGVFTRELLTFRFGRLAGIRPRATIQVILIREHGAVGTWTEEDVR